MGLHQKRHRLEGFLRCRFQLVLVRLRRVVLLLLLPLRAAFRSRKLLNCPELPIELEPRFAPSPVQLAGRVRVAEQTVVRR